MDDDRDRMICPTCGTLLALVLVGKVNPVYVARCPNVTVVHPTWVCTPDFTLDADDVERIRRS